MAAKPATPTPNPCCAALQVRCSKLEERRNALRQGCNILKDQLNRLEADKRELKKACDEEHAQADHERNLKEKETALRISMESKVAELESQLSCMQQVGSPQLQNLDKELMVMKEKVSVREAEIERLKQLLKEERRRVNIEEENAKMERQKAVELTEALEAEKSRATETCTCDHIEAKTISDSETSYAMVLQYKELAEENERKFTEERSYANNLLKQLEEQTLKVELLQKEALEVSSLHESAEARFAIQHSEKEAELNKLKNLLEVEKSRADLEQKKADIMQENHFAMLLSEKEAELNKLKSLLEVEKSRADAEQKKATTLKETLELERIKSLESYNLAQDEAKKAKESLVEMDRLKKQVSKLMLVQPKYENLTKKFEAEKQKLLRERQCADEEKAKALEVKKIAEENEKKLMEERSKSKLLSQQMEEEKKTLEMFKQRIKELEEELCRLKLSKNFVEDAACPDVNMSAPILLQEQLKLEKKRLKHAKQVSKLQKTRNNLLQLELGKLKRDFVQMVQHLDLLEETFCGRTQAVGESTKSSDMSKLWSLYLKKLLFGLNLFGKNEFGFVMPDSSTRRASGSVIPTAVYSPPENSTESPSGIKTKVHPLVGGPFRDISPSSAMNSCEASFSDKQLVGSQEQVSGSLAAPTTEVDGCQKPQATISKCSGQVGKRKCNAHLAAVIDNSSRRPLNNVSARGQKRRKPLDEVEPLKYMQLENRRLHQELEERVSKMNSKLNRLMGEQLEGTRHLLPDKVATQHDGPRKKRKVSQKPELSLGNSLDLAEQSRRGKPLAPSVLPGLKTAGSSKACVDHIDDLDSLLLFEQQIDGNVMKLLDLDNEVDEELFQIAIKNPLSPTVPEINCENGELVGSDPSGCVVDEGYRKSPLASKDIAVQSDVNGALDVEASSVKSKLYDPGSSSTDLGTYDHIESERNKENGCLMGVGYEQVGDGTKVLNALVSVGDFVRQTDNCELGMTIENIPLFCILYSCMEDISRISVVFFCIKRCIAKCCLCSQADWRMMDLLTALTLEQQLTTWEKTCVLFSLIMHNFLQVLSNKSEAYFDQGSISSLSSHLCSVLCDVENRGTFAELCNINELHCLYEDFVTQRRIFLCRDKDLDSISDFSSRFDILLEGKKVALYRKTASTREIVAASVIFSSICLAVGQISVLWNASFTILQMWPAEPQLLLYMLHCFACVCGGRYFSISNYSMQMEVVKSMVTFLESAYEVQGATVGELGCKTCHLFPTCDKCPFSGSLQPHDLVSILIEELQKYASIPMDRVHSSSRFSIPRYVPNKDHPCYIDIMSSVELISTIMGWSWTTKRVVPELKKLLESCIPGNFSTSLVFLLGRIGRLGVKSCGDEDAEVQSIKQRLSLFSSRIPSSGRSFILPGLINGESTEKFL